MQELDAIIAKSLWVSLTEGSRDSVMGSTLLALNPSKHILMRDDRRLEGAGSCRILIRADSNIS